MASRKWFKDFVAGLVSRFVSRNNDVDSYWGVGVLSKQLHDSGRSTIEFNLLEPQSNDLDAGSAIWLSRQVANTKTPEGWITAATLRVTFTPREADPREELWPAWVDKPTGVPMFRVIVTASLTDDSGRTHQASAVTWCWDHDPYREGGRAREWLERYRAAGGQMYPLG